MLPYRLCVLFVNSRVLYNAVFTFVCLIYRGFMQGFLCKRNMCYYCVVTVVQLPTNHWAIQVEELNVCHVLSGCRDSHWETHNVITQHITNKNLSFYSRSLLFLLSLLLLLLLLLLSSSLSSSPFLLLLLLHHCSHGHWTTVKAYFHCDTKIEVLIVHWRETGWNV